MQHEPLIFLRARVHIIPASSYAAELAHAIHQQRPRSQSEASAIFTAGGRGVPGHYAISSFELLWRE
jgi:hypothetical protein